MSSARVIAGSAGWYVVDPEVDGVTLCGPILSVELAHAVAEECDARRVTMMYVVLESFRRSNDWFAEMAGLEPDERGGYRLMVDR